MALKLKEFDFKRFLLEKGERVGLYAAGGIALLMVVLSLFLPGKGLLSPSPKKSADEILGIAGQKKTAVVNSGPTASEADDLRKVPGELQKQAGSVAEDPEEFRLVAELFAPREIPSTKRQNPTIFGPEEFVAAVVTAQVSNYMIKNERDAIWVGVLEGSGRPALGNKGAIDRLNGVFGNKGPGGMPGRPGGMGMGGGMPSGFDPTKRGDAGQFGSGSGMSGVPGGGAFGDDKKHLAVNFVRKDELKDKANAVFARDMMPLPMAEISGAFPLKLQIEEFKNALRAESAYNVVFQETVSDKEKVTPAFHFLGFTVQRKTYGPDGKVIPGLDGGEWQTLDLQSPNSPYVATVAQVLQEFAPEDPKLQPLLIKSLYMPRPVQVPVKEGSATASKAYPPIEMELPKIKLALEKMKEKAPSAAVAPSKFEEGPFNFADPDGEDKTKTAAGTTPKAEEWAPPDYAVLRFLDLTIQPGQTYEYQVKVKMQNPNWNKSEGEVANKQLTQKKELESEWYPVKGPNGQMLRVSVPTDLHLYALDQQEVDNRGQPKPVYKGMNAKVTYDASRQVPVQIHKWLGMFELSKGATSFFPVGDWVVGERIFATRGEYVGVKKVPTHVPIWSPEQSQFILAGRPPARPSRGVDARPTEEMSFIEARRAPLLLDFEGGSVTYRHGAAPVPKSEDGTPVEGVKPAPTTEVKASAGTELLLLTPDGKLVGRLAGRDEVDTERKEREEKYGERVADAEGKEAPAGGGKPGDPFGGKPMP